MNIEEEEAVDKVIIFDEPKPAEELSDAPSETPYVYTETVKAPSAREKFIRFSEKIAAGLSYVIKGISHVFTGILYAFKKTGEWLFMWAMILGIVLGCLGMGCGMFSVLFPITNNLIYESNYGLWLGFTIAAGVLIIAAAVFSILAAVEDDDAECILSVYGSGIAALGVNVVIMFACGFTHTMFAGGIAIAAISFAAVVISLILMLVLTHNGDDCKSGFALTVTTVALALVLSGITYTVVEQPNRHYMVKDGICYIVREDNTLTVFTDDFNIEELVIPNEIDGYRVTSVARPRTIKHNDKLKSVTIPDSVLFIEDGAFKDCTGLEHVEIPNSVLTVGKDAFKGCRALKSVVLPNGLKKMGEGVFENCISLTSVSVPSSITSVSRNAFKGCAKLTTVTVDSSAIGEEAFANCSALTSVTLSNNVTKIGARAFANDIVLKSIYIPSTVKVMNAGVFSQCISLTVYFGLGANDDFSAAIVGVNTEYNVSRSEYEQLISATKEIQKWRLNRSTVPYAEATLYKRRRTARTNAETATACSMRKTCARARSRSKTR